MQRVGSALVAQAGGDRAAGLALVRALVAAIAGVDAHDVRIAQRCPDCGGPHGRPVVMEPPVARRIGVSLAHAADAHVAAAVADARIGVDAEARATAPDREAAVRALLEHDGPDALRQWTRIEAVLKADGRGLRVEPSTVVLEETADGITAAVPGSSRRYAVLECALDTELVVSVAIEREPRRGA